MAATIKVGADLGPAQKAVDDFQGKLKTQGQQAGEALARGIEAGADKAADALDDIGAAAKGAAGDVKKLLEMETVDRYVSAIGPVKDSIAQVGVAMLGLSEATVETTTQMGDLAERGANFGKLFGPWGAAAGLAIGLIGGYFNAAAIQAKAAQDEVNALNTEATEVNESFSTLAGINLGTLIEQLGKLELRLKAAKSGGEEARKQIEGLAEKGVEALKEGFNELAGGEAARAASMGISELSGELYNAQRELERVKTEAAGEMERMLRETGEYGRKSAEDLKAWETSLLSLSQRQEEAEKKVAVYQTAIEQLKPPVEDIQSPLKAMNEELEDQQEIFEELLATLPEVVTITDELFLTVRKGWKELGEAQREIPDLLGLDALDPEKLRRQTDAEVERLNSELPPIELPLAIRPLTAEDGVNPLQGFVDTSIAAMGDLKAAAQDVFVEVIGASFDLMVDNISKGERAFEGLAETIAATAQKAAKALGKKWALEAGGEAAAAIASLAVGNIPGATLHGEAALAYAAMAGAAGVAAGLAGRFMGGDDQGGTAGAPSPAYQISGARQGGAAEYQELAEAQFNLAPGGTVIFGGDPRGQASFGRFTDGSLKAGRAGAPGGVRR